MVKADRGYFNTSLRKSWDALAVAEHGPLKGDAFQPLMPIYVEQLVSDDGLESLWHYLRTLADKEQQGPLKVMVKRTKTVELTNVLEILGEEIVTTRTRVMRAPIKGTSARSLHVGQPNGMSYTFDPRMLSVRRVWTGGYLNLNEERSGRGGKLSGLGKDAQTYIDGAALLNPMTSNGSLVDFEFKEPDAHDYEAIARQLRDGKDFIDKLDALDAEFLGHSVSPETGNPTFRFRVGENEFAESIAIGDAGEINIALNGNLKTEQRFQVASEGLADLQVSGGKLESGVWILPAGENGPFTLQAKLAGGVVERDAVDLSEDWAPQSLVTGPAKEARRPLEIQAGYTVEDWASPLDLLGREQLFEPTGIALAKDGTIVMATRTAGIWRIRDGKWTLFAEGIYEALGVVIEDDKGDVIVIAQKPELTRIRDTNGDGRADDFETACDDFGFHGNYHEYTHGPVRDAEGNYYFLLNLAHAQDEPEASWKAGGKFMGSMGGYRGWACRVTPGSPVWDLTGGKFGPYEGQIFMGDQTLSQLFRIVTEQVDGVDQGAVIPFANGLESGIMRPAFLPDGSLLLGQTGRGWGARGGSPSGLQRISYNGKTLPADIKSISATSTGFEMQFTRPLAEGVTENSLQKLLSSQSWFYTNLPDYGSPQHDKRDETISGVKIVDDRSALMIDLAEFGKGEKWVDRVYHLKIEDAPSVFGDAQTWKVLEGYFTLRAIPKS